MALWGGRFQDSPDEKFKQYNDSLPVDYRLATQDIIGSIGWSKALLSINILTQEEQTKLEHALNQLLTKLEQSELTILDSDAEDIHSWVEQQLISMVGDLGKKLHTGRSRNDQVATDLKLWCRAEVETLLIEMKRFQTQLVQTAEQYKSDIMPGYTHLQRAQPITFSHWCLAYFEMIQRDTERFNDALKRINVSPLGSGALAGTAYPIDRDQLAESLGFSHATHNSLDAVADRDHVLEILSNASICMIHLSRFAEDMIIFNSGEANFIELSDKVTSGSSLMPQKKNPDALELIRGKTGRVIGDLMGMLMTLKGLPLAYNKDMQEDKPGLFDAVETLHDSLGMATLVLEGLILNKENCIEAAQASYSNATELADYLVSKTIPFREAHHIVGEVVLYAISQNKPIEGLSLNELKKFHDSIDESVYAVLTLESCLKKRDTKGGVAINQIEKAISNAKKRLSV